jgi:hypothetical protein
MAMTFPFGGAAVQCFAHRGLRIQAIRWNRPKAVVSGSKKNSFDSDVGSGV